MTAAADALEAAVYRLQGTYRVFPHNKAEDVAAAVVDATLIEAAELILDLDDELRQFPGDKSSQGARRRAARLNGALTMWETVVGLDGDAALLYAEHLVDTRGQADPPRARVGQS